MQARGEKSYSSRGPGTSVYRRYKWVFDSGFYPRLERESLPRVLKYPIAEAEPPAD